MATTPDEVVDIRTSIDVVQVRQSVRTLASALGFSLIDQTKIVTAASELARNTLEHGGGGTARVQQVSDGRRTGLRLQFEDAGPGIPDVARALTDGFSTAGGLGLGLSGSKRLVDAFDLWTEPGRGTRVTVTKWK